MASGGRIKGITVEIGGDTGPLSSALKGVNGTIRETGSQLKDVNRLLKLDPTNVTLLGQKAGAAQKELLALQEKEKALKAADSDLKKQLSKTERKNNRRSARKPTLHFNFLVYSDYIKSPGLLQHRAGNSGKRPASAVLQRIPEFVRCLPECGVIRWGLKLQLCNLPGSKSHGLTKKRTFYGKGDCT